MGKLWLMLDYLDHFNMTSRNCRMHITLHLILFAAEKIGDFIIET